MITFLTTDEVPKTSLHRIDSEAKFKESTIIL